MESSVKNCRSAYSNALLWILAGVILLSRFHWSSENRGHQEVNFYQVYDNLARQIEDGFVTLMVKLFHFYISRCLQFRYLPALQHASSMYMLFWVPFAMSISSMQLSL